MSVRCPNPVCRVANEEQAWHCAKCGCPMSVDPSQIEHDEDRMDLPTMLVVLLVFSAGLGVLVGTIYGVLPPAASDVAGV